MVSLDQALVIVALALTAVSALLLAVTRLEQQLDEVEHQRR
jgi:hypothetical protein